MRRGVLVLHMLRKILDNDPRNRGRDLFREVLAQFYRAHAGGRASTADFIDAVEQVTGTDWDWFFDQWVFGRATPTLTWGWQVSETPDANGAFTLIIEVDKTDVPADFLMLVPVWAHLSGGRASQVVLRLDAASHRFEYPLPERPEKLTINPRHEVLAQILEKK
jgi:aminopeptidase N